MAEAKATSEGARRAVPPWAWLVVGVAGTGAAMGACSNQGTSPRPHEPAPSTSYEPQRDMAAKAGSSLSEDEASSHTHTAEQPSSDEPLAAYRWKRRPLLVFSDGPGDDSLREQRALIEADAEELTERHMVVVEVTDRARIDGVDEGEALAEVLRNRFRPTAGLSVILVGKDGGEKLRSSGITSLPPIFATIDSMPMRMEEMRAQEREPSGG